jgi:hypothetical protein
MSVKNRLFSIVGIPAGAVWLVDSLVVNMPLVMEGAVFAGGIAVAAMGVEGCRKLLHQVTADKPTQEGLPASEPQLAPEATFPAPMTVQALPVASPREDLLRAYQMGAAAAQNVQRIER